MSPPRRIPSTSSIANSNNPNPTTTSSAAGSATGRRIASHSSIASLASNGGGSVNGNNNGGMGLGSGSNTELRAQLRRERDAQKREATTTITSSSSSQQHLHHSTQPLPHPSSSNNNNNPNFNHGNGNGGSNSNTSPPNKVVETQSNTTVGGQRRVISEGGLSIPQSQSWNNNQVQSSHHHHHHHQPSQRITASASNSSLGSNHTNASSNPARPTSASTADTSPFEHQLQPLQQQHPSVLQPPEPFDNSFSLEALQAAYSAKYYETANKCKNWERYSAKLRAQAEALEIENRLLRELNSRQEDQIGGLRREKEDMRREMEWLSRDKKDIEDRLSSLQRLLQSGAQSRSNSRATERDFEPSRLDGSGSYHSAQHAQQSMSRSYAQGPQSAPLKSNMLAPAKLGNLSSSVGSSSDIGASSPANMPSSQSVPYCSSNLGFDEEEQAERAAHLNSITARPPSPISNTNLTSQIQQLYDIHNQHERTHLYAHEQSHSAGLVMTHGGLPHTLRPASRTGAKTSSGSDVGVGSSQQWPNPNDILASDAAYRETAAIYGEGRSSRMSGRAVELFPPSHPNLQISAAPKSAPLTSTGTFSSQYLNDQISSQHQTLRAGSGPTGVQRLRVSPNRPTSSSSQGSGSANTSSQLGAVTSNVAKRRSANSAEPGMNQTSASVPNLHLGSENSSLLVGKSSNSGRTGSAMSDAATVTGEYLRDEVEARRQNRRSTLNQQQRDQFQAQIEQHSQQRSGDDGGMPSAYPNIGGRPPSRPTSRMSNLSTGSRQPGGRSRSRAGSVHDSIPIVMDDVFSERSRSKMGSRNGSSSQTQLNNSNTAVGIPASASAPEFPSARSRSPLQQLQVNQAQGSNSSASGSIAGTLSHHSNSSFDPEGDADLISENYHNDEDEENEYNDNENQENQAPYPNEHPASPSPESKRIGSGNNQHAPQMNSNPINAIPDTPSSLSLSSQDPRGAHRALYSRLRNELGQAELTKFEKYVHRYDALEIPLDGPRGLVNRVKKLLLVADPTVRENPEKLKSRKQLAREFERIVRVDLE